VVLLTGTEIFAWVDRKYPNQETSANKIIDLNQIHKEVFVRLKRLKHEYEEYETLTVADQLEYTLPTDCTIDNIISLQISESSDVTTSTDFVEYTYAGLKDELDNGYHYTFSPDGKFLLADLGDAVSVGGKLIKILYYETPVAITSASDTPELDSQYHMLLCYGLVQTLAAQGHNPDTEMADYYQNKFDEYFRTIETDLSDKFNTAPANYNQVKEWF